MLEISKDLLISYVLTIDNLRPIITSFENKISISIITQILKYGVLVCYKRGSLGIEDKYFEGLLASKFASKKSEDESDEMELSEGSSFADQRQRGPTIHIEESKRKSDHDISFDRHESMGINYQMKPSSSYEKIPINPTSNAFLFTPNRESLKERLNSVQKNDSLSKNHVKDRISIKQIRNGGINKTFNRLQTFKSGNRLSIISENESEIDYV